MLLWIEEKQSDSVSKYEVQDPDWSNFWVWKTKPLHIYSTFNFKSLNISCASYFARFLIPRRIHFLISSLNPSRVSKSIHVQAGVSQILPPVNMEHLVSNCEVMTHPIKTIFGEAKNSWVEKSQKYWRTSETNYSTMWKV